MPEPHFYFGLDLGQKNDPCGLAGVERRDGGLPHFLDPWTVPPTIYALRYLERIALGTPYPRVVERLRKVMRTPELLGRSTLVADGTGLGRPVFDMLRQADLGCRVVAVSITGGQNTNENNGYISVPRRDLLANLELMIEYEELQIAAKLPERRRLVEEFVNLGVSSRVHDDLVFAVALACWQARKPKIGHQGNRIL